MNTYTLPAFTGKIHQGLSETKQQSRARNDMCASSRYAKRLDIDHYNDQKAERDACKEVWE